MSNENINELRKEFILGLYDELGVSLLGLPEHKKFPNYEWDQYYYTRVEREILVNDWLLKYPNYAMICGVGSGYIAIDFDVMKDGEYKGRLHPKSKALFDYLSSEYPSWVQKSGGGEGRHLIYKIDPNRPIPTQDIKDYPGVEIRGEKSLIVLAYSIHPSGNLYELLCNPLEEEVCVFPYEHFEGKIKIGLNSSSKTSGNDGEHEKLDPNFKVRPSGRHRFLIEQTGHYCRKTPRWKEVIIALNLAHCEPPLELGDLEKSIFVSGTKYSADSHQEKELIFKPIKVSELMQKEFDAEEFIVDNLIPEHGITIISGYPGSFKTFITLNIAIKVAKGETCS